MDIWVQPLTEGAKGIRLRKTGTTLTRRSRPMAPKSYFARIAEMAESTLFPPWVETERLTGPAHTLQDFPGRAQWIAYASSDTT